MTDDKLHARRRELFDRVYRMRQKKEYLQKTCFFCSWASNGLTWEEAGAANEEHERNDHPEEIKELKELYPEIGFSMLGDNYTPTWKDPDYA